MNLKRVFSPNICVPKSYDHWMWVVMTSNKRIYLLFYSMHEYQILQLLDLWLAMTADGQISITLDIFWSFYPSYRQGK